MAVARRVRPKTEKTSDLVAVASTITSAVAAGQDTPNEAAALQETAARGTWARIAATASHSSSKCEMIRSGANSATGASE